MPEVRLIDANALAESDMAKLIDKYLYNQCNLTVGLAAALMPEIEAEPVRRGQWIRNATSEGYHCSNCGHHADSPIGEMIDPRDYECYLDKYCGGCGAQMYADGGTISKERFAEIMRGDDDGS